MDNELPTEVDVVIAGGGAAACVLAARLVQADPSLEVVIIEAGPDNKDNPTIVTPALYVANLLPDSGVGKYHLSEASEATAGRPVPVLSGAVLGGGSSINFMIYARALAHDFDAWKTEGWAAKDLMPLLNKLENYCEGDESVNKGAHGTKGEFRTSIGGGYKGHSLASEDVLKAGKLAGIEVVDDIQDGYTTNGIARVNSWIDPRNGQRQDAAHVLIHPILRAENRTLRLLTEHQVNRVIFDENKKAVGVEIVSKTNLEPITIRARRQVVLSAGAFGTPLILERSGVGEKNRLTKLGVPVVADIPGVGSNYLDHQFFMNSYKSRATEEETLDGLWNRRVAPANLIARNDGIMGWTSMTMIGKLRPTSSELKNMDPEFQKLYERDYERAERPLGLTAACSSLIGEHIGRAPAGQYFTLAVAVAYGYSTGSIHASGTSVDDAPEFQAGFLSNNADLEVLVWQYKKTREIARRMLHYDGPYEPTHPVFPSSSKAGFDTDLEAIRAAGNNRGTLKDIEYSAEDDEAIRVFVRGIVGTMWHSAGTSSMKPFEEGGVVDKDLNVYGVSGLKIADLSVIPSMVGANTYSTALLVGEKASEILLKALKK